MGLIVELGVPYTGWPVRAGGDYSFGLDTLSDQLIEDIESWAKEFNREFSETTGWPSDSARDRHHLRGNALAARVQAELGDKYDVRMTAL